MVGAPVVCPPSRGGSLAGSFIGDPSVASGGEEALPSAAPARSIALTLLMSTIGSGLLSVPYAFSQTGVCVGVLTLLAVAIGAGHTAESLLHCHLTTGLVSYNEIAEHTFGPTAAVLVPVVVVCAIFGGCVSYVAIILSVMPTLADLWHWQGPFSESRFNHIFFTFLVSLFVIMPLNMVKNLSSLRFSSAFGLCFSFYLVFLILYQAIQKMETPGAFHQPHLMGFTCPTGVAVAFSIFSFAYVLHLNVVPLYLELEDASPRKMIWVIRGVMALTTIIYGIVGYCGFMLYGEDIKSNVLVNFSDSPAFILARVAVCLAVVMSFPLLFFPLRVTIHNLVYMACGWTHVEPAQTATKDGIVFMALIFLAAVSVPDLGTVFSITGGTSVVILIFTAPLAFSLRLSSWEGGAVDGKEALLGDLVAASVKTEDQPIGLSDDKPTSPLCARLVTPYRWFWIVLTPMLGLWATGATVYHLMTSRQACHSGHMGWNATAGNLIAATAATTRSGPGPRL